MLGEVKKFHKDLPKMSNDFEISKRLQKVVETAFRNAYYDLRYAKDKKEVLKNHLITALIDERAFERAKNKEECIRVAEKIADESLRLGERNLEKFLELYVKWNEAKSLLE